MERVEPHCRLRDPRGDTVNNSTELADISSLLQTVKTIMEIADECDGMERVEAIHAASILAEDMTSTWEPDLFDDDEQRLLSSLLNNVH